MTPNTQAPANAADSTLLDVVYLEARHGLALARIMTIALEDLSESLGAKVGTKVPREMDQLADVSYSMNCLVSVFDKVLSKIDEG